MEYAEVFDLTVHLNCRLARREFERNGSMQWRADVR